jgi:hypothetical protein
MMDVNLHPSGFLPDPADEQACAEFQQSMAAQLTAGADLKSDPHLRSCARCQALLRDLEAIAQAARQLLPIEADPPDTVWAQIERALSQEDQHQSSSRPAEDSHG